VSSLGREEKNLERRGNNIALRYRGIPFRHDDMVEKIKIGYGWASSFIARPISVATFGLTARFQRELQLFFFRRI
jgi:hypothetical protein